MIMKMIVDNAGHDINYCKDHDEYDDFDDHDKNNLSPKIMCPIHFYECII